MSGKLVNAAFLSQKCVNTAIFVLKIGKYGIFVAKIYKYALIDSFQESAGSLESAASCAALVETDKFAPPTPKILDFEI